MGELNWNKKNIELGRGGDSITLLEWMTFRLFIVSFNEERKKKENRIKDRKNKGK